jgi:hypothetical protein
MSQGGMSYQKIVTRINDLANQPQLSEYLKEIEARAHDKNRDKFTMIVDIIRALPKWLVIIAFFVLVIFMVISISFGKFSIAGYEFGFGPKGITNPPISYSIKGQVKKEDQKPPSDVQISSQYPPLYPTGAGTIVGLRVWKDPDGKFPVLAFQHDGYAVEAVDLNDKAQVEENDGELKIKETIVLKPIHQE